MTGSEPRFLRRELHGTAETEPVVASEALWWPPAKIAGRHLGPFLAELTGESEPYVERPDDALAVRVPLEPDVVDSLHVGRFAAVDDASDEESGAVSSIEVCEVAPEDTLGEIAERMLHEAVSAVLVCEYGTLIGVLTTKDLIAAFAARVHPSEARARQWMTAEPIILDAEASRAGAARLMRTYGIHHLPVVEHGDRPVGVLHLDEETPAVIAVGLGF